MKGEEVERVQKAKQMNQNHIHTHTNTPKECQSERRGSVYPKRTKK